MVLLASVSNVIRHKRRLSIAPTLLRLERNGVLNVTGIVSGIGCVIGRGIGLIRREDEPVQTPKKLRMAEFASGCILQSRPDV
jgi:hypothetical protein